MASGQLPPNVQVPEILLNRTVQIAIAAFFVVLLIVGIVLFMVNKGKDLGQYKPLLKDLDQARALEISSQLNSKGLSTEVTAGETGGVTVSVRDKQFDQAALEMAKSDLLLTDDFKLFDKTDWAASDYEKRIKYMRAVSGELSRMVSRMYGVRWGKVHVTIPPERLFTSRYIKDKTSASVMLELEPEHNLTSSQVSSILSLVSGYIPEIETSRISITDTKGHIYSTAYNDGENTGLNNTSGLAESMNLSIQKRVQEYLDIMLGLGKSKVVVSTRLVSQKMTQNKTVFSEGAIGNHEYSEEALGDAAKGNAYRGNFDQRYAEQNYGLRRGSGNMEAPSPRPVIGYPQSQGYEMVDPRLEKDMPQNRSLQQQAGINNYNGYSNQSSNQGMMNNLNNTNTQAPDNNYYTCAANDEACKRNYRRHNFSIQSYPSYEQTIVESPSGTVQKIKVSVVIDNQGLNISTPQLKAAIAAAADPNMLPEDVEIINKPLPIQPVEKEKKTGFTLFKPDGKDLNIPWWGWLLIIIACFIVLLIAINIGKALFGALLGKPKTFRDRIPFSGNNNESFNQNNVARPAPPTQTNSQTQRPAPPVQKQNVEDDILDFETNAPTQPTKNNDNLPFDLEDEFAIKGDEDFKVEAPPQTQPRANNPEIKNKANTRQRSKITIEDE